MTAFELLEALGEIEEEYLTEEYDTKRARLRRIRSISGIAASVVLFAGISAGYVLTQVGKSADSSETASDWFYVMDQEMAGNMTEGGKDTMADVRENATDAPVETTAETIAETEMETENETVLQKLVYESPSAAMGFEGLIAYDVTEIVGSNPWSKDYTLTSLPVYENLDYIGQYGIPVGTPYNEAELTDMAYSIAGKLGMELISTEAKYVNTIIPPGVEVSYLSYVEAEGASCSISVRPGGGFTLILPEATPVEAVSYVMDSDRTLQLYETVEELFELENPATNIFTSYNIYGEQRTENYVWDMSGELKDQILSFNFQCIMISSIGEKIYFSVHEDPAGKSMKYMGDYPIISWEEAAALLLEGRYISTVPEDLFGAPEDYAHVELVYRTQDKIILPYYKFRVHLEEWDNKNFDGEKHWGTYYVPAVSGEYLDEASFWDGRFN